MPRRKAFEKWCYYHCFNRWLNRQEIFLDDSDYKLFLELFTLYKKKYNHIKILELSTLPNHFHFVIKSLSYGYHISRFFERLVWHYAKYFIIKYWYPKWTNIFEWRFKSEFIDTEAYLNTCKYYVFLNPVKHWYVNNINDREYRYSSEDIYQSTSLNFRILEKREKSQDLKRKLENEW